jgi:hypothetical protein
MHQMRRTTPAFLRSLTGTALGFVVLLSGCVAPQEPNEMPQVFIGGFDYAFDVPDPIPSGLVELVFQNRGQVRHEVLLVELIPGTTITQLVGADSPQAREAITRRVGGVLIAEAGEEAWARLQVELTPGGTYGLICNFRDSPDALPHIALGMVRTFQAE